MHGSTPLLIRILEMPGRSCKCSSSNKEKLGKMTEIYVKRHEKKRKRFTKCDTTAAMCKGEARSVNVGLLLQWDWKEWLLLLLLLFPPTALP